MSKFESRQGRALLTAAQMRAVERDAMERRGVTGARMMERAGRGVAEAIARKWPDLAAAPHRAVILCGPGNNGGDGFVVARLLKGWGWEADVFLLGDAEKLPPDARENHDTWSGMGDVRPLSEFVSAWSGKDAGGAWALGVDALFGTGLTRPVEGDAERALAILGSCRPATRGVSVDIPSGLCADSGRCLHRAGKAAPAAAADLTVTFERPKTGHMIGEGPLRCGQLEVVPLGLRHGPDAPLVNRRGPTADLSRVDAARLDKPPGAHKYGHGHAVILSGQMARTGAARLAARGALRAGAGLVTVAAPGDAVAECAAQLTAIMLRQCDGPEDLAALLSDRRLNAVCLGPGLGTGQGTRRLVAAALDGAEGDPPRSVVLDADALTAFADDPDALFAILPHGAVLTPHGGEFARLFPDIAARLSAVPDEGPAFSRLDAVRLAASRAGCTVLLKGADTVIAADDRHAIVNCAGYERAAPWLATAGAGDVLAGMIVGLLARGFPARDAAEQAAWLHTEAGRLLGPGLIAEDLPEALPRILASLQRGAP